MGIAILNKPASSSVACAPRSAGLITKQEIQKLPRTSSFSVPDLPNGVAKEVTCSADQQGDPSLGAKAISEHMLMKRPAGVVNTSMMLMNQSAGVVKSSAPPAMERNASLERRQVSNIHNVLEIDDDVVVIHTDSPPTPGRVSVTSPSLSPTPSRSGRVTPPNTTQ